MTLFCVDLESATTVAPSGRFLRAATLGLVCLALLMSISWTAIANDEPVRELLVDWANTSEEHAASARYYAERAAEARQEVVRHDEMGARYAAGDMETRVDQEAHCERIAVLNQQLASEYEALARNHREEAERRKQESNGRRQ